MSRSSAPAEVSAEFFAGVAPCTMKLAPGTAWKADMSVGSLMVSCAQASLPRKATTAASLLARNRIVALLELLEQLDLIGGRNARTGITHRDAERTTSRGGPDQHLAAVGELDGVADQIEQDLGKAMLVAMAAGQVRRYRDLESELLSGGERLHGGIDGLHHVLERIIGKREGELAGLDLRQVKHVIDQAEEMLAIALHAIEHAARLLRHLAIDTVEHQLGIAQDGIERRAQLVAHVGEELRLVLASLRELPSGGGAGGLEDASMVLQQFQFGLDWVAG